MNNTSPAPDTPVNPFDAPGDFLVLENDLGQRCLWPHFADVPAGWQSVHGPVDRDDALAWIEEHDTGLLGR